jgi:hypothetical protein
MRPYTCQECGKVGQSKRPKCDLPKYCAACLIIVRRRNAQVLREYNPKPEPIISKCLICGKEFIGKNKYRIYLCCSSPDCRLATRHRAGQTSWKQQHSGTVVRSCLRCGKEFKAPHKFIRLCGGCKVINLENRWAENWGSVI